ncbi:MvdC/MvdD family ATP grasp protein [Undibacterium sp. TJN19]|uniref:MvdC/MvdD family ATP grasp protein n=1 Tax=Undibacterium sp. TJN19 TaxID=3413055 RepID=UPI003BF15412
MTNNLSHRTMHLFIYSQIYDAHAISVKAALESIGVKVTRFLSDQLPINAEISTLIETNSEKTNFFLPVQNLLHQTDDPVDVVWLRRPVLPQIAGVDIHPDDVDIVVREWKEYWQSFLAHSFPTASWINPWLSSKRARSKLVQLNIAKQVGLQIPKTLFSNNSDEIRHFIKNNSFSNGTIVKSFLPVNWKDDAVPKAMYATKVDESMLPDDSMLRAIPTIYQERITKSYEVRCTFFGSVCHSAKIVAKKNGEFLQDWRQGYYSGITIEPYNLPKTIEEKCQNLMFALGLKFGCFDFIVSTTGEYVFLEVNEAGQFLWIERYCPEIKMMNAFCEFVLREGSGNTIKHASPNFTAEEVGRWPEVCTVLNFEKDLYAKTMST